jgi:hypothetical protein
MRKKKRSTKRTVVVPIADLARGALLTDRLCPDVGMGMSYGAAIDEVLTTYGLKREDVDYDGILEELCGQ